MTEEPPVTATSGKGGDHMQENEAKAFVDLFDELFADFLKKSEFNNDEKSNKDFLALYRRNIDVIEQSVDYFYLGPPEHVPNYAERLLLLALP